MRPRARPDDAARSRPAITLPWLSPLLMCPPRYIYDFVSFKHGPVDPKAFVVPNICPRKSTPTAAEADIPGPALSTGAPVTAAAAEVAGRDPGFLQAIALLPGSLPAMRGERGGGSQAACLACQCGEQG